MMKYHTDPRHAVFIINPVSGSGDHAKRKAEIIKEAKALGWKGKIHETTKTKDAGVIAAEAIKDGAKHIVVCGGDGTILEAMQTVLNSQVVLGIVPLGTGNLFAQNLNIIGPRKRLIALALNGKVQKIDVGRANGTFFAIIASIGFDAEIMRGTRRSLKRKFGFFAYLYNAMRFINRRPGKYKITIDDTHTKVYRAKSIMVANMGKLQGGIKAIPDAHWQSGTLSIAIIQASGYPAWLRLLGNAIVGNLQRNPHYTLLKSKKIEIEAIGKAKQYQCDGNNFHPTKYLAVEILPKALPVVISE